jgi:hypothetical protein
MAADPKGCDYRAKLKPSVHDLASDRRIGGCGWDPWLGVYSWPILDKNNQSKKTKDYNIRSIIIEWL